MNADQKQLREWFEAAYHLYNHFKHSDSSHKYAVFEKFAALINEATSKTSKTYKQLFTQWLTELNDDAFNRLLTTTPTNPLSALALYLDCLSNHGDEQKSLSMAAKYVDKLTQTHETPLATQQDLATSPGSRLFKPNMHQRLGREPENKKIKHLPKKTTTWKPHH